MYSNNNIYFLCLSYSNVLEEQFWWKNLNKTTQEDYLEFLLGKKERYNSIALISLTLYYLFIIFVGVIGNVLTVWIIIISTALQTLSNYFLCNLAVVDLVTLLLGKYSFLFQKFSPCILTIDIDNSLKN